MMTFNIVISTIVYLLNEDNAVFILSEVNVRIYVPVIMSITVTLPIAKFIYCSCEEKWQR